jgi:hypothetical protein
MTGIEFKSPEKAEHFQDLARGMVYKLQQIDQLAVGQFIKVLEQPIFSGRMLTYTIGAGITCFWEVQVKLLASQLGIEIYEGTARAKAKSPTLVDLEPIIEEIKRKLPKLEFNFGRLVNLRNAMVHGNFHQIRSAAGESKRAAVRNSFKGNVLQVNLGAVAQSKNLSEIQELEQIRKAGLYSWFLDVGNSELFETIILEFQDGIDLISAVVSLKSLSFNETKEAFNKLCIRGEKFSEDEREAFLKARVILDRPAGAHLRYIKCIEDAIKKTP